MSSFAAADLRRCAETIRDAVVDVLKQHDLPQTTDLIAFWSKSADRTQLEQLCIEFYGLLQDAIFLLRHYDPTLAAGTPSPSTSHLVPMMQASGNSSSPEDVDYSGTTSPAPPPPLPPGGAGGPQQRGGAVPTTTRVSPRHHQHQYSPHHLPTLAPSVVPVMVPTPPPLVVPTVVPPPPAVASLAEGPPAPPPLEPPFEPQQGGLVEFVAVLGESSDEDDEGPMTVDETMEEHHNAAHQQVQVTAAARRQVFNALSRMNSELGFRAARSTSAWLGSEAGEPRAGNSAADLTHASTAVVVPGSPAFATTPRRSGNTLQAHPPAYSPPQTASGSRPVPLLSPSASVSAAASDSFTAPANRSFTGGNRSTTVMHVPLTSPTYLSSHNASASSPLSGAGRSLSTRQRVLAQAALPPTYDTVPASAGDSHSTDSSKAPSSVHSLHFAPVTMMLTTAADVDLPDAASSTRSTINEEIVCEIAEEEGVEVNAAAYQPETSGAFETVGNFILMEVLGRGQQGVVRRAVHVETGAMHAAKVFPREKACHVLGDMKKHQQLRELSVSLAFSHDHIIKCHEIIKPHRSQFIYLIMQFAEGGSAATVGPNSTCTTKPMADLRRLARQAGDALQYLHRMKVTHRDIKPDNLLLDKAGNLLLSDFGVCSVQRMPSDELSISASSTAPPTGHITGPSDGQGAFAFRAPEEFENANGGGGGTVSSAVDMWSLGVTLYGMTFGVLPFVRPTFGQLRTAIKEDSPDFGPGVQADRMSKYPQENAVELSWWVDCVLRPLLEKKPRTRLRARYLMQHLDEGHSSSLDA